MKNSSGLFKKAFITTLPVMAAYLVIGLGFGMLAMSQGIGSLGAVGMSIIVYAGASQYVAAELFGEGASLITIALTTLFVNIRYLFYSFSMIEKIRGTGWAKPYLVVSTTDETYSILTSEADRFSGAEKRQYFFLVCVMCHLYWICGTLIGALAGELITLSTEGIDFSLTALFVTVFINHWRTGAMHFVSLMGIAVSAVMLFFFGADSFLLPAMLVIVGLLLLLRPRLEGKHE